MASPKFKVLRRLTGSAGAPAGATEGEISVNFAENKVYIHNGTTSIPVAGKGEFVDLGSEQSVTGKKNFTAATVSTAPSDANDAVRKTDLDAVEAKVDALGSAFNYVGTINGGATSGAAFDLSSLTEKDAGDYYKVAAAGYFVLAPAAAFYANANDGIVFNLASGVDKIDNTDSSVAGTANEITVTGSTDSGYTVAIATEFKDRMTAAETAIAGLGTISTQDADAVAITGGSINGTTIGGTTAAAGSFTTISASGQATISGNLVGIGTNQITDFVIDAGTF
jgi:hypothetical protein